MEPASKTLSLAVLVNALQSGELPLLSYLDQLEAHFEEIEPTLQAFVPENGRFDRLRQEAAALQARFPKPENRPPLFGIAIGVKDIFHVNGFTTRAGSALPPELFQGQEANTVTTLRRAGALILGKTVTTEFAYFGPGPTRNPYKPDHTPGGSSSGSAAAVGAAMCHLTLGTQTIGSINRPAAYCGVVGFKPSYDRITRDGVLPLSNSLDHVGFFTPSVIGADNVANLLCRYWQLVHTVKKPVLGIPEGPYLEQATSEGLAHFQDICDRLQAAGFIIKRVPTMPDFAAIRQRHMMIVDAELAQVHANWFADHADLYKPETAEHIRRGQQAKAEAVGAALNGRFRLRQQFNSIMDKHKLDLWITPAAPGPAPQGLDNTGDPVMNLPWSYSGLPTLTLPSGFAANGLPLGLQLVGRWYADEAMLSWAADIEPVLQATLY